jgi:hypothetical protein
MKTEVIQFRADNKLLFALDIACRRMRISKADFIRMAIKMEVEKTLNPEDKKALPNTQ